MQGCTMEIQNQIKIVIPHLIFFLVFHLTFAMFFIVTII